jgi:hypothetical protein
MKEKDTKERIVMGFVISNEELKNSSLEETVNPKITKYPFITQCEIPSSIVVNMRG